MLDFPCPNCGHKPINLNVLLFVPEVDISCPECGIQYSERIGMDFHITLLRELGEFKKSGYKSNELGEISTYYNGTIELKEPFFKEDSGIGISEIANEDTKDKHSGKYWQCPLCSNVVMKYGETCKSWPECGQQLNINGKMYRRRGDINGQR